MVPDNRSAAAAVEAWVNCLQACGGELQIRWAERGGRVYDQESGLRGMTAFSRLPAAGETATSKFHES